jgi:hypothetical protein
LLGAAKSLGVAFGIFADHQSFRNLHAAVDHDILQSCSASDHGIRHDHRIFDTAIGMDMHAGEQQRPPYRRAGNDAAPGHQ